MGPYTVSSSTFQAPPAAFTAQVFAWAGSTGSILYTGSVTGLDEVLLE